MQRTANLELPIFEQNDRPTWLVDVNDAMQKIDTGYGANVGQAEQAIAIANEAKTTAESAEASATNAVQTATAANTTANGALTAANRADLNASNAYTTAQAAQTAAGNAATAAAGAQSTADNALNAAATAQSTADAANTAASAAQSAAAQAAIDAGAASTAASTAQTAASTAQSQAQAAASSASAAQAAATASAGRINTISNRIITTEILGPEEGTFNYSYLISELRRLLFENGIPKYGISREEPFLNPVVDISICVPDFDNDPDYILNDIYHLSFIDVIDSGIEDVAFAFKSTYMHSTSDSYIEKIKALFVSGTPNAGIDAAKLTSVVYPAMTATTSNMLTTRIYAERVYVTVILGNNPRA